MRKIRVTKLLISAWMLMVGFAVQAQVYTEFNMTGKKPAGVQYTQPGMDITKMDKHQYGYMTVYTPKQQFQAPKKAEPGEVTLTFNLVYDPAVFMPPFNGVTIINENYKKRASWMGQNVVSTTVPPGIYDFVVHFISNEHLDQYYVIREQVEVSEDATYTFNPEEATNHISFINYGPDGNVLKHDLFGGIDEETGELIILDEGDIETTSIKSLVYLKGIGSFTLASDIIGGPWPEELRTIPFHDYFVTDVSDRYVFTQTRVCEKNHKLWYLSYFSTDNVKVDTVANNPDDYVLCHEDYQFSPHGQGEIGQGVGSYIHTIENGYYSNELLSGLIEWTIEPKSEDMNIPISVYSCVPYEDPNYRGLNLLVGHQFIDYCGLVYDEWEEYYDVAGNTISVPYTIERGQQVFKNLGHFDNACLPIGKSPRASTDNNVIYELLPVPPALDYPVEERLGVICDNCPINAANIFNTYSEYFGNQIKLDNVFIGRYGESRWCDNDETKISAKYNGEEIEWLENYYNVDEKGVWEFTITNNNVVVDGLQGKNETVIYFDQTKEDNACPGIEMLHFRSEAGITDRFTTAAEGVMEFMGGDFSYRQFDPQFWIGNYECQPMDVTVEYSPYGDENWQELVVEEVPELFQMPGWGYFYRASLADVTGKATRGWFDLRFTLQDEAGNWQEQVISPAFRIDDLVSTGVEEVTAATEAREVARYSVDGRQLSAPQSGLNIIRMSDGTSRKVWVK